MIIDLLAVLMILGAGITAGILLTVGHRAHVRAERQAEEDRLAEQQELYAAWAMIHAHGHGGLGPSAVDPRDRILT
jgi:hypothetical protein